VGPYFYFKRKEANKQRYPILKGFFAGNFAGNLAALNQQAIGDGAVRPKRGPANERQPWWLPPDGLGL
jgi:hypothetical protein